MAGPNGEIDLAIGEDHSVWLARPWRFWAAQRSGFAGGDSGSKTSSGRRYPVARGVAGIVGAGGYCGGYTGTAGAAWRCTGDGVSHGVERGEGSVGWFESLSG